MQFNYFLCSMYVCMYVCMYGVFAFMLYIGRRETSEFAL